MGRGKNLGARGRFHSYGRKRKDCKRKYGQTEDYALQKSIEQRRERDSIIRMNPDLSKVLIYRKEFERDSF